MAKRCRSIYTTTTMLPSTTAGPTQASEAPNEKKKSELDEDDGLYKKLEQELEGPLLASERARAQLYLVRRSSSSPLTRSAIIVFSSDAFAIIVFSFSRVSVQFCA